MLEELKKIVEVTPTPQKESLVREADPAMKAELEKAELMNWAIQEERLPYPAEMRSLLDHSESDLAFQLVREKAKSSQNRGNTEVDPDLLTCLLRSDPEAAAQFFITSTQSIDSEDEHTFNLFLFSEYGILKQFHSSEQKDRLYCFLLERVLPSENGLYYSVNVGLAEGVSWKLHREDLLRAFSEYASRNPQDALRIFNSLQEKHAFFAEGSHAHVIELFRQIAQADPDLVVGYTRELLIQQRMFSPDLKKESALQQRDRQTLIKIALTEAARTVSKEKKEFAALEQFYANFIRECQTESDQPNSMDRMFEVQDILSVFVPAMIIARNGDLSGIFTDIANTPVLKFSRFLEKRFPQVISTVAHLFLEIGRKDLFEKYYDEFESSAGAAQEDGFIQFDNLLTLYPRLKNRDTTKQNQECLQMADGMVDELIQKIKDADIDSIRKQTWFYYQPAEYLAAVLVQILEMNDQAIKAAEIMSELVRIFGYEASYDPVVAKLRKLSPQLFIDFFDRHAQVLIGSYGSKEFNPHLVYGLSEANMRKDLADRGIDYVLEQIFQKIELAGDVRASERSSEEDSLNRFPQAKIDSGIERQLRSVGLILESQDEKTQMKVVQFLEERLFPYLWKEYYQENPWMLTGTTYELAHILQRLPISFRSRLIHFLDHHLAPLPTSDNSSRDKPMLDILSMKHLFETGTKEEKFQLLSELDQIFYGYLLAEKQVMSYLQMSLPEQLAQSLVALMPEDPQRVIQFIDQIARKYPERTENLKRLKLLAYAFLEGSEQVTQAYTAEVRKYQEKYDAQTPDQLEYLFGIEICYLHGEKKEKIITANAEILKKLAEIYESLPPAKKADLYENFLVRNQERLAKIQLFFPQYSHANRFLLETAMGHGFPRLEERLKMMDGIKIEDIIQINTLLVDLPAGEVNQGFIYGLITLLHTYSSPELQMEGAWLQTLSALTPEELQKPGIGQRLIKNLGKDLLIGMSTSLGIEASSISDESLDRWNLDYLPRLLEGVKNFTEEDLTLFHILVKGEMRGEIDMLRDPNGPAIDKNAYAEDEVRVIEAIRDHNRLVRERFAQRGLDYETFRKGVGERRLRGIVTGEEILDSVWNQTSLGLRTALEEMRTLSLPDFTSMEEGLLEAMADVESKVMDIRGFITEQRESELNGNQEVLLESFYIDLQTVLKMMLGSRDGSVQPLLDAQEATEIRKGNFLRTIRYGAKGEIVSIGSNQTLSGKLKELQAKLNRRKPALSAEQLSVYEATQQNLQLLISQTEKLQSTEKNGGNKKKKRPDVKKEAQLLEDKMLKVFEALTIELEKVAGTPQEESVKTVIDHLRGNQLEWRALNEVTQDARDQEYDVTIRRWDRKVGTDIFQGNYTNCCVAIDSFNGYGMLRYVLLDGIELNEFVDNTKLDKKAIFGQTYDFIGETPDNTLFYHLDNGEVNASHWWLAHKMRTEVFDMSKELSVQMKLDQSPETFTPIEAVYLGTSYNDLPTSDLTIEKQTIRMLTGHNLGSHYYLDTVVDHTPQGNVTRMPTAFHHVKLFHVANIEPERTRITKRETPHLGKAKLFGEGAMTDEMRYSEWGQIRESILKLENDTFGLVGYSEGMFENSFLKPETIAIYTQDAFGRVLGYSFGFPSNFSADDSQKEFYISSSAVDYNLQGQGIGKDLGATLVTEIKKRGYTHISRDSMADTGYAQQLIAAAGKKGLLVEPTPVLDVNSNFDLTKTLKEASLQEFSGHRFQYHIVTQIE